MTDYRAQTHEKKMDADSQARSSLAATRQKADPRKEAVLVLRGELKYRTKTSLGKSPQRSYGLQLG